MKETYFELYIKTYITMLSYSTLLPFLENYCAAVTKKYWALKKGETVNLTNFVLFSFLY